MTYVLSLSPSQMKFYLDSANLEELKRACSWGIIDGVTTNPSLIAKEGVNREEHVLRICDLVEGDVSAEVVSTTAKEMISEGLALSKLHSNVVVKIPLIEEGIKAASMLKKEGVRVNITLCFSAAQALIAAKTGAYIVSPFVGRVEDIGWPGMDLLRDIVQIYGNYGMKTQILAASLRGVRQVIEAAKIGVHICTLNFKVLEQMFHHPLTDSGLEQFLADHQKSLELVSA